MPRIRVVLADDNATLRHGLRRLLESDGRMEVVGEARDGLEAVELATRLAPDLVLMDIRMPGKDGLAAARAIRACCPKVAIIMLTSYDTSNLRFEAHLAGVSRYLPKDIDGEELLIHICAVHENP